ncbi:serine hydrolase [Sphingomonas sinipercae]|uniref:Beta-lactamase n=1 Tax=Sphingomonas sinipercae TaxID=2714944 RepID=A0A6G7ZQI7_9SPHN|nr:serine hydrolase [Sphingomonas sinipercae]QIL03166.1 serine hydrolase [Sphingomonas sinipercae]
MRLTAIFLCLLAFIAQPAAAATSPSLWGLERQLSSLLSTKSADVGVAALDLNTGEMVSFKGDHPFPMASTVKVAVAALYLAQVDHGRRSLDDTISGQSARSLMRRMLIHSDNGATDVLIRDLGGPQALDSWLKDNGVQGLRVDRTIAQLLRDKRDLWDRRDSSTPTAMVDLLRRIYKAELITPKSRNYLLDVMGQCQTGKNRIKGLLPGVPVEHKTGTLNGYSSDVGFITMPDGRRVAVAFFARGGDDRPRTIAQAARAIYDGFWAKLSSFGFAGNGSPR